MTYNEKVKKIADYAKKCKLSPNMCGALAMIKTRELGVTVWFEPANEYNYAHFAIVDKRNVPHFAVCTWLPFGREAKR